MIDYIRAIIAAFLYPALLPALDECNRQNLSGYFKANDERTQEHNARMLELQDYMRVMAREAAASKGSHQEHMAKLETIAEAIRLVGLK